MYFNKFIAMESESWDDWNKQKDFVDVCVTYLDERLNYDGSMKRSLPKVVTPHVPAVGDPLAF